MTQVKQKSQTSESFSQSLMHIFDWSCTLELSFVDNGLWSRELWKKKREFLKYCRDVVRNPEWFLQMKSRSWKNGYYLGIKFSRSCKKILPCWRWYPYFITSEVPLSRKTPFNRLSARYNKVKDCQRGQERLLRLNNRKTCQPQVFVCPPAYTQQSSTSIYMDFNSLTTWTSHVTKDALR